MHKNEHLSDFEVTVSTKTGEKKVGLVSISTVIINNRKFALSSFLDITERKQAIDVINILNATLEQKVMERTAQLDAINKELEAFSYSVSHDLRSPLRGIDGWSLALLEDYGNKLDEEGKNYLNIIRSETQRMGNLIDDILKLSKMSRSEMKKQDINLSRMAEEISLRLKKSSPLRNVSITIQNNLIADCDKVLIESVLTNLLDNAFKFTGKISEAQIEFGQTIIEDEKVFYIKDNGIGFDMNYSKKLFGVFQRMHKQSEFPGTGIGLATVQRIINRHGGRIWAEAKVNEGAIFYFTI